MEKPSKYHDWTFNGKEHSYTWNSSHLDLEPTEVFYLRGGYYSGYCVYCCEQANPIQAGLRRGGNDYAVTGYCCTCEAAEQEKVYRKEFKALQRKHEMELYELDKKFKDILAQNKVKMLEMFYQDNLKQINKVDNWRDELSKKVSL